MANALLAAVLLASAAASAQSSQAPTGTTADGKAAGNGDQAAATSDEVAGEIRRQVDARVEAIKKEMRAELQAQLATQTLGREWQEEWVEEKRKLELFTLDGYLRLRPDLFYKFDLNREADATSHFLFPRSPASTRERTVAGANMRLRLEPTLNVSEEVRIHMQVDVLDNLVLGTTPDYAFSRSERNEFSVMSETQLPPRSAINSLIDSIMVKRAYGEVSTPVGILRFGRMGSHWGLGMLYNDGNCLDCDHGTTVDRIQFVTMPATGWYVTPMLDFNVEGPTSGRGDQGQPFDLSNSDDAHSYVIAVARADTEQQAKAKLENGEAVFNFGLHLTYRTQTSDATSFYTSPFQGEGGDANLAGAYVPRSATLVIPDVWAKYERKAFRIELEAAAVLGSIDNRALSGADAYDPYKNQRLYVTQFGGMLQGEYRAMDGKLKVGAEIGYASGDPAPGLGNYPRRRGSQPNGNTAPGDFEGPQYNCPDTGGCVDDTIGNFRFNRDYRVDLILWREILGGVTDTVYFKPSASYQVAEGFHIYGSAIYSRALFASSTPSGTHPDLGIELDAGARYEAENGFMAGVAYGILFPLTGLTNTAGANPNELDNAQAIRGWMGIRF